MEFVGFLPVILRGSVREVIRPRRGNVIGTIVMSLWGGGEEENEMKVGNEDRDE